MKANGDSKPSKTYFGVSAPNRYHCLSLKTVATKE